MPDIVVMFFLLGLLAGLLKSDLSLPKAAYDTLSLILMLTLGLKGGLAMHGNLSWQLLPGLLTVLALGVLLPLLMFPIFRVWLRLNLADAASLTAHYGSVSAGTFAVALAYALGRDMLVGPEATLFLVLLEVPAIVVALLLYSRFRGQQSAQKKLQLWHETLTNRGVILLLGGVIIGWLYGPDAGAEVSGLFVHAFKAILALFLLEMGLVAAETLRPFPWKQWRLLSFALLAPGLLALLGLLVSFWLGLPAGTGLILASLLASASYIAAPVAIRTAIADADIGLAMLCALGLTFPLNVLVGIPVYAHLASLWL